MTRKLQEGIWKRLHDAHKNNLAENHDEIADDFYIIPCDECGHFGNCNYETQCEQDVKMGSALEHFKEINK